MTLESDSAERGTNVDSAIHPLPCRLLPAGLRKRAAVTRNGVHACNYSDAENV